MGPMKRRSGVTTVEQGDPAVREGSDEKGTRGEMTKAPISLGDLRRSIYAKAKAESSWRFWGLYVHVCKMETLWKAYAMARENNGAPGIDGVTFGAIEEAGVEGFLTQIRDELISRTYRPMAVRKKEIPKDGGRKVRVLSIPAIRDRVVQGALKLILEPIFEADFQPGSYGYRPKRTAHDAVERVDRALWRGKTRVIDLDLKAFFDNVRHHILLEKVAGRVNDDEVMHLLKMILKSTGKKGVPQGGVISPLLSNLYLTEVDKMLEKAKEVTRSDGYDRVEYARYADDLVVLVDAQPRFDWVLKAVERRLREELAALEVEVNEEKSRKVELTEGEGSFGFLGFEFRRVRGRNGKLRPQFVPKMKKRTELLRSLKPIFRGLRSQPVEWVLEEIKPRLRGWVNYFNVGDSYRCFSYIRDWVEKKVRRHLMRAKGRSGFGWKRWSRQWLYEELGLFNGYELRRLRQAPKALPGRKVT
jgi:RNA-directed DNA polymerase